MQIIRASLSRKPEHVPAIVVETPLKTYPLLDRRVLREMSTHPLPDPLAQPRKIRLMPRRLEARNALLPRLVL